LIDGVCLMCAYAVVCAHELLDALCKESKPSKTLTKQRKLVQQYGKEGIACFPFHKQALLFAEHECQVHVCVRVLSRSSHPRASQSLLALCTDAPGLCAPKLPQLLGAAALARYEVRACARACVTGGGA
jgi:hypothetical protein